MSFFNPNGTTLLAEMKYSDGVIQRDHRNTDVRRSVILHMQAVEGEVRLRYSRPASLQCETVARSDKVFRRSFVSPTCDSLKQVTRSSQLVNRSRQIREQLLCHAVHDLVRVFDCFAG